MLSRLFQHPNDVRSVHVSTTLAWYPNLTQRCLSQFINRRSVNEMLISHDDAYYESRKPKPDLGTWRNLKRSVWNHEKRLFLDRSCEGWGKDIEINPTLGDQSSRHFQPRSVCSTWYSTEYYSPYLP